MHITGGEWKGRPIAKSRQRVRPLTGRMRETLFAVLRDISGFGVLDLFAGTGSFSLEALSRGAMHATLVERNRFGCREIIQRFSHSKERVTIHAVPVERFVRSCTTPFDVVFIDPPYRYRYYDTLLGSVARLRVATHGVVIVHHEIHTALPLRVGPLRVVDRRVVGQSVLQFYSH